MTLFPSGLFHGLGLILHVLDEIIQIEGCIRLGNIDAKLHTSFFHFASPLKMKIAISAFWAAPLLISNTILKLRIFNKAKISRCE